MGNRMISSIGVLADETFCYVNHAKEPLSNKLMMSECSLESGNMNQLILVEGISRNSCDNTSSTKQRARATNCNCNCNVDDGSDMK